MQTKKHKFRQLRRLVCLLVVFTLSLSVMAQQGRSVSGAVTDVNGEPLIGASVVVKGTKQGTATDMDGKYSVSVSNEKAALVVSYLGYITQEIPVNGQNIINVSLPEQSNTLEDVVVIGYGVAKKKDLTGAVASVGASQINAFPVTRPEEALQGRIAGADITKSNGYAGEGVTIRIRGNRSISNPNSSNNPLVIVDGMQGVELKDISPSDIVSMDVLKDASSTSIYGARGANGVIIVTTKAGQAGRAKLNVNSYFGISNVAGYGDWMNADQYIEFRKQQELGATANADNGWLGKPEYVADLQALFNKAFPLQAERDAIAAGTNNSWPTLALKQGFQQEHTFNITAGSENTKIYMSGSIFDEQGILKNDHYTRYTGRVNVDQKVYSWLDAGMRAQMAYSDNDKRRDPFNVASKVAPIQPVYNEDGSLAVKPFGYGEMNPLLDEDPNNWQRNIYGTRFSGAAYAEIKPLKGLTLHSNFGTILNNQVNGQYFGLNSIDGKGSTARAIKNQTDYRRFTWENILTYMTRIADIHALTFTGVQSMEKSINTGMNYRADNPAVPSALWYSMQSTNALQISGDYSERSYSSWVGRVNYILMDKYIFNASIRADGSSKLGGKWEQFPSIGGAWRISDENFIKETAVSNVLSNLKLRAAWGNSGNDDVNDYATQMGLTELNGNNYYSWDGTAVAPAYRLGDMMGNTDLLWEKTNTLDFGVDLGLFKNRINLTFDYYDAKTTDLLFPFDLPATTGTKQINKNFGTTRNKGFEFLLETRNIATKDFLWNTTVTFTKNKETIVSLPEDKSVYAVDYRNSKIIGYPAVVFYSYINDGIWQIDEADEAKKYNAYPGDLKIRDISGPNGVPDEKIDPVYDRTVIGKVAPDWYGGMSNDLRWKGFDLNIFMTFRVGSWITSDYWAKYNAGQGSYNNGVVVNYWTPENTTGVYPRPGRAVNGEYLSMLSLRDNSFFKIRNITLGYALPKQLTERYKVGKLRVWASVKNALIFAKEPTSFDPENEGVIDQPLNKLMTLGLNIEF